MKKITISLIIAFAIFLTSVDGNAAAPSFIPLQGFLENADGTPVNGDVNIHYAIYDSEVGGFTLWYETQNVHVEDGVFAVYLGEVEAIDLAMFRDNTNLWLGIQVESDPEMGRVYLGSTPYTGYAEYCGNIPDHGHDYSQITGTDMLAAGPQSCTGSDKVVGLDMSGSLICATDEDTTYLAGAGLQLSGNTFSADTSVLQARVIGTCAAGSAISTINADGTVLCESDDSATYDAGAGLLLTGTTFNLDASYLDGSAYDARFVNVSGDTMTGALNLPADGLAVGTDQLVATGGSVGIGTASPGVELEVAGNIKGSNLLFTDCGGRYTCTPRQCLDLCISLGMRMATYEEVYAWASGGSDACRYMWMLHEAYPDNPCRGYPMYHNRTTSGCGRLDTGDIPRIEGHSHAYTWTSTTTSDCACAGLK